MKISMKPVVKEFSLSGDPSGDSKVIIRQVTAGDNRKLGELNAEATQIWDPVTKKLTGVKQRWNAENVKRERIWTTLVQADLEDEEKPGASLFPSKQGPNGLERAFSREVFNSTYDALPDELWEEIYAFVIDVNPQWSNIAEGDDEGE
jgi:hypothetical protein